MPRTIYIIKSIINDKKRKVQNLALHVIYFPSLFYFCQQQSLLIYFKLPSVKTGSPAHQDDNPAAHMPFTNHVSFDLYSLPGKSA